MARDTLQNLTEPMYFLLLSLYQPRHGYLIMQHIKEITNNRVSVGAGTMYALLSRFEEEDIIKCVSTQDSKKIYQITNKGKELVKKEYLRLNELINIGGNIINEN